MTVFSHLAGLLAAGAFMAVALGGGRAEADDREVLPTNVQPLHYKIDLVPDMAKPTFAGHVTIDVQVTEPTSTITLNAKDMTFDSVSLSTVQGAPQVSVDKDKEQASFTFAAPVQPGKYTLDIAYHGTIYDTSAGLFVTPYANSGRQETMLTTQFEPGYARRLAPMWDEPAIKSVFELSLTVPDALFTLANTPAVATTEIGNGLKKVQFGPTPKMSSYLLFVGAGNFDRLVGKGGETEIGVVTRKGAGERGRFALETASQILPYYNDYFGMPFPLPKLDLIGAPGAGGFGAMENWGAIFYFENALLVDPALTTESDRQRIYSTIAHEMAHQWFGDLVTMAWWDDLWLNEGFASWMQAKASDHFHPEWDIWLQELRREQDAMNTDSRASTHPIVQHVRNIGEAESAFDDITYSKGQAVIRMLEAYLGNDAFRNGVRAYMKAHAYGNTVTQDLWKELETASKTPVTAIAHDFTMQPGVPLIIIDSVTCDGGQSVVALHQDRFGTDDSSKQAMRWHVPIVLQTVGSDTLARAVVDGKAEIKVPGCGAVKVNAGATGYFRTFYPADQFADLKANFVKLAPIDQLGMLYDAWALGESGYQPITDYLGLASTVSYDADPLVWQQIANTYGDLEVLYRDQPGRDAFLAYARGRLKPEMQKIGWTPQAGEKPNVSILRDTLIQTLAQLGDPDTIGEANKQFDAFEKDPSTLTGATKRAVLRAVTMHGDAAIWEKIRTLAKAAGNPLEQRLYLTALAATMDDGLAEKTLTLAISDETPKQVAPRLIGAVATMHPDLVWAFLQAHQAEIFERVDEMARYTLVPSLAGNSNDPKRAEELKAYFAKTFPNAPTAEVNMAASRIQFGAGVRTKRLPEINDWLNRSQ